MKSNSIIAAVIGGLAIVIFAAVLANAYKYKYKISNTINVTGNAKKDFESDIVKWSAYFNRKSMDLSAASEQLKKTGIWYASFWSNRVLTQKRLYLMR